VHVAAPTASDTVLPATQLWAWPDASDTANVTVPVGVPARAGRPETDAVTTAGSPSPARVVWILVLELAGATVWVIAAAAGATSAPPG
jgi:hypothetical protein